jgi:hypothetical protein
MHVVTTPSAHSMRVYDRPDSPNYSALCNVVVIGDRGFIVGLSGSDFYRMFRENGLSDFKRLGLVSVEAAVTEPHFRLIQRALRGVALVEHTGKTQHGPIPLLWVRITELESAHAAG